MKQIVEQKDVELMQKMLKENDPDIECRLRKFGRQRFGSGFSSGLCVMAGVMQVFSRNILFGLEIIIAGLYFAYSGFVSDDVKPLTAKEKKIYSVATVLTIVSLTFLTIGMIGVLINSIAGND